MGAVIVTETFHQYAVFDMAGREVGTYECRDDPEEHEVVARRALAVLRQHLCGRLEHRTVLRPAGPLWPPDEHGGEAG